MEYTTLRISKPIKEKLSRIKKNKDISYDQLIVDLIEGNSKTLNLETFGRTQIAFSLSYYSYDREELDTYDVSYFELKQLKVGDVLTVPHKYNDSLYYEDSAEIVFIDDISVVVRIVSVDITEKSKLRDVRLLQSVF